MFLAGIYLSLFEFVFEKKKFKKKKVIRDRERKRVIGNFVRGLCV